MYSLVLLIVLGAIAGWIATSLMHTKQHGLIPNILIGMIGAIIGGYVVRLIGGSGITGFNIYSIIVAVIGSVLLLWFINWLQGSHRHHR